MKANARRYRRYRFRIPADLFIGKKKLSLETADVGMSGVFVCTNARPNVGEFVRLALALPFGGGTVELLGRVTSVRDASNPERPAGIGVAFYGNGPTERDAWQGFVRELERRHPEAVGRDVVPGRAAPAFKLGVAREPEPELDVEVDVELEPEPEPATAPEPQAAKAEPVGAERRRYQRFEVNVEVKAFFESIEDLVSLHTRDLSKGGMFIATSIVTSEGERLTLRVVHPNTKDEFSIPCIVRRCVRDGAEPGLAVEFQLDEAGRNEFWTFIGGVLVVRTEPKGRTVNYF